MPQTGTSTKLPIGPRILPLRGRERLAVWEKARGMWKHRVPDPLRELKQIRKEWERRAK
ncbi:MAG: hypothetical protein HYY10_02685 [Candidatus Liptonbacteria bacterium]|nr:hypothetical protein [Candidatus Liptonbacteria bacterium]